MYRFFEKRGLMAALIAAAAIASLAGGASAAEEQGDIEWLRLQMEELLRRDAEKQRLIDELRRRVEELEPGVDSAEERTGPESALDRALKGIKPRKEQAAKALPALPLTSGTQLQLMDISIDALISAGSSTESDASLQTLQGGDHDPRKRGFRLRNLELSFLGAVDPYFDGEAHIIYFVDPIDGESRLEIEEAFLTTRSLPHGLQLEVGQFFTEFGRLNPKHPHAWLWMDQPVIHSRLFGEDGIRQAGVRLGWLTPLPWFSELHVGAQSANGETMVSFLANDEVFEERPIGGRPFVTGTTRSLRDLVYLARWENSFNLGSDVTALLGASGLLGPNPTGPDARTWIYGADLVVKWRPARNVRGWPFLVWESEAIRRDYEAARFFGMPDEEGDGEFLLLPQETLEDWGLVTQLFWGFRKNWALGARYEFARGNEDSIGGKKRDPYRDTRQRISPLLAWYPTEFSRLQLQYNYDRADHLRHRDAHTAWLGFEFLLGAHPGHKF